MQSPLAICVGDLFVTHALLEYHVKLPNCHEIVVYI